MGASAASKVINKTAAIEEMKKWLAFIMKEKRWNGTQLANAAGIAPSTVLRMFSDKNYSFIASYTTIGAIAAASGFKPPQSLIEAYGVNNVGFESAGAIPDRLAAPANEARLLPGKRRGSPIEVMEAKPATRPRLRVRNVLALPRQFHFGGDGTDEFVETPPRLQNDPTAFAFRLKEAILEPAIPHSSLMYASKVKGPHRGDILLITKGDGISIVRIAVDIHEDGIVVAKGLNTSEVVTIPMDKIADVSVVVMAERP